MSVCIMVILIILLLCDHTCNPVVCQFRYQRFINMGWRLKENWLKDCRKNTKCKSIVPAGKKCGHAQRFCVKFNLLNQTICRSKTCWYFLMILKQYKLYLIMHLIITFRKNKNKTTLFFSKYKQTEPLSFA